MMSQKYLTIVIILLMSLLMNCRRTEQAHEQTLSVSSVIEKRKKVKTKTIYGYEGTGIGSENITFSNQGTEYYDTNNNVIKFIRNKYQSDTISKITERKILAGNEIIVETKIFSKERDSLYLSSYAKWDSLGHRYESYSYNESNSSPHRTYWKYDTVNNITYQWNYFAWDTVGHSYNNLFITYYNERNIKVKMVIYDQEQTPYKIKEFQYDSLNNMTELVVSLVNNDKIIRTVTKIYYPLTDKIKSAKWIVDEKFRHMDKYFYDDKWNIIKLLCYNGNNPDSTVITSWREYKYDSLNRKIEEILFYKNSDPQWYKYFAYNQQNDLILEKQYILRKDEGVLKRINRYVYEYYRN